ncbi:hypothetical protein [Maridesulfovibrio bastinii]|uniref:hypothetical protein n=1 Tax=Maridesulfovibrio bastinii TaxID=47157 RepID=UPI0003F85922|nr:hypothetical protein [Maridesulfovibrio bastinii]
MNYTDHYLKFTDEAEMLTVYQLPTDESEGITYPGCSVDVVGMIVHTPAEIDEDGNVITEAVFSEGWHVNVRSEGELPEALKPFEIPSPETPARVWL